MKKNSLSTADFVFSFPKKEQRKSVDSLEIAFFETQKKIKNIKTIIELEVMEDFVTYFFEGSSKKRQQLCTQIHQQKKHRRREMSL